MHRILGYFRNYKLRSVLSPLFKLSEAAFELTVPLVIADIIDKGIPSGDSAFIRNRFLLLLFFAVVGFISAILAQYFAATVRRYSVCLCLNMRRSVQVRSSRDLLLMLTRSKAASICS